jgi:hypothetical protein
MTAQEFIAFVRSLTYKPGAWFEIGHHDGPGAGVTYMAGVGVTVWLPTPDCRDPSRTTTIPVPTFVPAAALPGLDEAGAYQVIREMLVRLEMHELDEWLRRDGQPLADLTGVH